MNNKFQFYTVSQELVNFLKGDDVFSNRNKNLIDKQIWSHWPNKNFHKDKFIGIIIKFNNQEYYAPLTHDGNNMWLNRGNSCDSEPIFNKNNKYMGSILLCKAIPLTNNIPQRISFKELSKTEGFKYAKLCEDQLNYLNKPNIHNKIQDKMLKCINNEPSPYQSFRVNYQLAIKNVAEYNAMKLVEKEKQLNESNSQLQQASDYIETLEEGIIKAKDMNDIKNIKDGILRPEEILKNDNNNKKSEQNQTKKHKKNNSNDNSFSM